MGNESGTWIMYGVEPDDPECIHTVDEAIEYINKVGFLPLFKNGIPGFSLEERTVAEHWWSENPEVDPWEWRAIIARSGVVAYGKFFDGKGYRCAQASCTGLEGCQCVKRNRYILEDEVVAIAKEKAAEELELLRKNKPKWQHATREWKGTEALQNKADRLAEKKIRLYDQYKEGKLTKAEYLEQVKTVTDKLTAVRGQLAEIHNKASEAEYNLAASVELEERLRKVKDLDEYDTRVLKLILDEVIVGTDGTQEYHWTISTS